MNGFVLHNHDPIPLGRGDHFHFDPLLTSASSFRLQARRSLLELNTNLTLKKLSQALGSTSVREERLFRGGIPQKLAQSEIIVKREHMTVVGRAHVISEPLCFMLLFFPFFEGVRGEVAGAK